LRSAIEVPERLGDTAPIVTGPMHGKTHTAEASGENDLRAIVGQPSPVAAMVHAAGTVLDRADVTRQLDDRPPRTGLVRCDRNAPRRQDERAIVSQLHPRRPSAEVDVVALSVKNRTPGLPLLCRRTVLKRVDRHQEKYDQAYA
jgi:hypothetical protein